VVVPHTFVQWTNEHDITLLLEARWQEHLIEDHLLRGGAPRKESQEMLLRHRLERARLELALYHAAVDLQKKSGAGHAACKLISSSQYYELTSETQAPVHLNLLTMMILSYQIPTKLQID
jgi:hypothetical protein